MYKNHTSRTSRLGHLAISWQWSSVVSKVYCKSSFLSVAEKGKIMGISFLPMKVRPPKKHSLGGNLTFSYLVYSPTSENAPPANSCNALEVWRKPIRSKRSVTHLQRNQRFTVLCKELQIGWLHSEISHVEVQSHKNRIVGSKFMEPFTALIVDYAFFQE